MNDDAFLTAFIVFCGLLIAVFFCHSGSLQEKHIDIVSQYMEKDYVVKFEIDEFLGPIRSGSYENVFSIKHLRILKKNSELEITKKVTEELKHTFISKCNKFYSSGRYLDKSIVKEFKNMPIQVVVDFSNNTTSVGPINHNYITYIDHKTSKIFSRIPDCK